MTRAALQERLLRNPRDADGWSELRNGQGRATAPTTVETPPAAKVQPLQLLPLAVNSHDTSLHQRPLQQRFHPVGSPGHREQQHRWLDTLAAAAAANRHDEVLRGLGPDLVETLAQRLDAGQRLALGESAHRAGRHDLAQPLLASLLEVDGEQGLWALFFLAEEHRLDGRWSEADAAFESLTVAVRGVGAEELLGHTLTALAWLRLAQGRIDALPELIDGLAALGHTPDRPMTDLELLGRVTSTLTWLGESDRQALPHARDLALEAGLVAAVDLVQMSTCGSWLQLEGWIVDPGRQLKDLCLIRGGTVERLDLSLAKASARPDLEGVLQRCGAGPEHHPGLSLSRLVEGDARRPPKPGEAVELFLVLRSGEQFCLRCPLQTTALRTPELKQVLDGAISNRCELQLPLVLHRVRELWSDQLARQLQRPAEHRRHGNGPLDPALSVVVPLYGRIDFMEFQLNWFSAWRRRLGSAAIPTQLIYVLDDPRQQDAFEALVKRCRTLYGMPFETIVNPENMGYAGANNRGAAVATAPLLLLLNSDVLPAEDSSLASMVEAMDSQGDRIGALGARLLFDNGGLQHGGMEFGKEPDLDGDLAQVWLNDHPLKGVNVSFSDDEKWPLVEVEAATAACLLLRRERFEALGGFSTVFVVGDFEDSDLCLRLRQQGLGVYVDRRAVFYHLERQSVGFGEVNDQLKMKVVAANAFTHHQRWASVIEVLKASRREP
jgi:GT2 family glycosyltransferase